MEGKLYLKMPSPYESNRDTLFMMVPLIIMGWYLYGERVLALCAVALLTALICDYLVAWFRGTQRDRMENSSAPAALMMTMLFPATIPYYAVITGTAVLVLLGKAAFGGWGVYPFNLPALGYCTVAVCWPQHVARYPAPYTELSIFSTEKAILLDGPSHVLRVGGFPNIRMLNLLFGEYAGTIGTGAILVIIACAMYFWMRREIDLSIPAGFLLTCALIAVLFPRVGSFTTTANLQAALFIRYQSLKYELLTGAMLYSAVFLINDPCTRPKERRAYFAYGALLGLVTMLFRYFGSDDTGVCFSILIVNAISGYLDRLFSPKELRREMMRHGK